MALKASQLDLKPLYYFVRVAEGGSFSRAAASLSVSQSILSRVIRRLEEDLAVQLLHRTGRGVQLTDAGQRLLEHGREIIAQLVDARSQVAALSGEAKGAVSLGMPPLLGAVVTIALVERLRTEHPSIRLTIREGYAAETLDWLGNGQVDIGIIYNPPQVATLIIEKIIDDTLHLVGAPGSLGLLPGSVFPARMLGSLPLVLPPQPHRLRGLVDLAAREADVELHTVVEATGTLTVLELVRAGLGYTVLPSMLLEGEAQDGRLQSWPLTEPDIHPRLCLATSMQRPQTEATRVVLKTLSNILRARTRA